MSDTIYKLQKRVEQYSTEASVYQEETTVSILRFLVLQMPIRFWMNLGKPGSLSFQTADGETVLTGTDVKAHLQKWSG